ncbi:MAG: CvpA family protein [Oscillospiraceae bacterium]|nr:CvpA family protein [Oscillospiraceae bacterium]
MKALINIVLIGILIICVWSGYKKGIVMGVGGLIVIVVALWAANLVAATYSDEVLSVMRPFASGFVDAQLTGDDGVMERMGWGETDYSAADMLVVYPERIQEFCSECYQSIGIYSTAADEIAEDAVALYISGYGEVIDCVSEALCENASYVAFFILAFLLILIILTVIGNLPNLSYKIPNLDIANNIGGALLGLATGMCFCIILVWFLKFAGIIIGEDTLSSAGLASLMLKLDFVQKIVGI